MTKLYRRRYIDPRDQYRRWIDERLSSIRLDDVTAYLNRTGWVEVPSDRHGFRVFREPNAADEDPLYQFLPDSEEGEDYTVRFFELLTGIAEFEDRSASAVIDDIVRTAAIPANGAVQRPVTELTRT